MLTMKSHLFQTSLAILLLMPSILMGLDYNSLASAVAVAESNNNTQAVGDSGKARGAYQMWRIAWDQVNKERAKEKRYRYPWTYAHDAYVSRQYAIEYLRWCGGVLEKELGRKPLFWEVYASYARGPETFRDEHGHKYSELPARTKRAIGIIASQLKEIPPR
jgi:hypothetical protein